MKETGLEVADAEAAQSFAADEPEPTVSPDTSMVAPEPEQRAKSSTLSEETAARQAENGTEDPASTTVVEITSEFCETYRVHEGVSVRLRFEVVSDTDTVPATKPLNSSVSIDTLAERESPSVVLAVNVVVPSSPDTLVPVDAAHVAEVVEDAVLEIALDQTAVVLEDQVLSEEVMVLVVRVEIKSSLLTGDELAVVGVALEEIGEVTEGSPLVVEAVLDVDEATPKVEV